MPACSHVVENDVYHAEKPQKSNPSVIYVHYQALICLSASLATLPAMRNPCRCPVAPSHMQNGHAGQYRASKAPAAKNTDVNVGGSLCVSIVDVSGTLERRSDLGHFIQKAGISRLAEEKLFVSVCGRFDMRSLGFACIAEACSHF
jgi:hypothetical protein